MRRLLFLAPLLLLINPACTDETIAAKGKPDASTARPRWGGDKTATLGGGPARVTLRLDPFGLTITNAKGDALLDTIDSDPKIPGDSAHAYGALGATHHETQFQSSLIEGWDHVTGTDDLWHHATVVGAATLSETRASLELFDPADEATTIHLDVRVDGTEVRLDATVSGPSTTAATCCGGGPGLNQMGLSFSLAADEHFFGLGERFATVDHRGKRYQNWVEEGGIGGGEKRAPGPDNPSPNGEGMTHAPIPFLLSSRGYSLWLDTTFRTAFSLGSDAPTAFRIEAEEPALHVSVFVHDDPKGSLAQFTERTGRAHLPAPWVFGPRRRVDHGPLVEGVPEEEALRAHHVPTTMVDDTTHFLPINSGAGQEAFLGDWTARMHAMGFKAISYFNAYVSLSDPVAKPLVDYGRAHDLFVRTSDGVEFDTFMVSAGGQQVATLDMTNPAAVAWFQSLQNQAIALGYDGWMLDFGEYLPQRAKMFDGRTGWEMHNAFPIAYQHAAYDGLARARGDDFMFFARSGYTGVGGIAPVIWSGDPDGSFDEAKGLPAQVRAGINAGLSGIPFWGSDISGYTCANDPPPDKELYLRWAEFGALSSDMHDENACAQKPKDAPNKWTLWSDAETTRVYARYASLHTRLFPYLYATAKEAVETGLPVIRHPMLMAPHDPAALAANTEYWFGPALYVAPVVHRGDRKRTLSLPAGKFVDWWTNEALDGGKSLTRDAPLDVLPLFLRSGGVVAMLDPSVETLAPDSRDDVVSMHDVEGMLDVRAVIDAVTQRGAAHLVDGTDLYVELEGGKPLALPSALTLATDEATLATCSGCGRIDPLPSGGTRVRITTESTSESSIAVGALLLRAARPPRPTRFRWDVVVL